MALSLFNEAQGLHKVSRHASVFIGHCLWLNTWNPVRNEISHCRLLPFPSACAGCTVQSSALESRCLATEKCHPCSPKKTRGRVSITLEMKDVHCEGEHRSQCSLFCFVFSFLCEGTVSVRWCQAPWTRYRQLLTSISLLIATEASLWGQRAHKSEKSFLFSPRSVTIGWKHGRYRMGINTRVHCTFLCGGIVKFKKKKKELGYWCNAA